MGKRIYVGNLPFSATDAEIRELFSEFGTVDDVNLITDRETGRLRGFGFVEMSNGADAAIQALHQKEMGGKALNVNEAKPRQERRVSGSAGAGGKTIVESKRGGGRPGSF